MKYQSNLCFHFFVFNGKWPSLPISKKYTFQDTTKMKLSRFSNLFFASQKVSWGYSTVTTSLEEIFHVTKFLRGVTRKRSCCFCVLMDVCVFLLGKLRNDTIADTLRNIVFAKVRYLAFYPNFNFKFVLF